MTDKPFRQRMVDASAVHVVFAMVMIKHEDLRLAILDYMPRNAEDAQWGLDQILRSMSFCNPVAPDHYWYSRYAEEDMVSKDPDVQRRIERAYRERAGVLRNAIAMGVDESDFRNLRHEIEQLPIIPERRKR